MCAYLQKCQDISPKGVSQPKLGHALDYPAVLRSAQGSTVTASRTGTRNVASVAEWQGYQARSYFGAKGQLT